MITAQFPEQVERAHLETILRKLESLGTPSGDVEGDHSSADDLLCEALEVFGQTEMVKAFRAVKKWYA